MVGAICNRTSAASFDVISAVEFATAAVDKPTSCPISADCSSLTDDSTGDAEGAASEEDEIDSFSLVDPNASSHTSPQSSPSNASLLVLLDEADAEDKEAEDDGSLLAADCVVAFVFAFAWACPRAFSAAARASSIAAPHLARNTDTSMASHAAATPADPPTPPPAVDEGDEEVNDAVPIIGALTASSLPLPFPFPLPRLPCVPATAPALAAAPAAAAVA